MIFHSQHSKSGKFPVIRSSANETDFPEPTFEELQALVEDPKFTEVLRESEKEIATNPAEYGTTAEGWERIRQWPGEFYDRGELYDREEGTT